MTCGRRLERLLDAQVAADQGRRRWRDRGWRRRRAGDSRCAGCGGRRCGDAQAAGAVVAAPLDIDRRAVAGPHAPERIDVGREQRARPAAGSVCRPPTKWRNIALSAPSLIGEQIDAARLVDHRDVQVHGAARLVLHRLGHEGGVDAVAAAATWRTMRLNTTTWSDSGTGSPWMKLISSCAAPDSWIMVSTLRPAISEYS